MFIVVNFKDYQESTGQNAVILAKIHEKVAKETGADIAIAVHPADLRVVASEVSGIRVLSQSADSYMRDDGTPKATQTGRMTPSMISQCGGKGALVNHAENPRKNEEIAEIVGDFKAEMPDSVVIVCAESPDRGKEILQVCGEAKPDFIAVEPPELIGGDVSVTTMPEVIEAAVAMIGDNVLVGAGVKTGDDIVKARELGAKGVLLASGVVKPKGGKTPEEVLRELALAALMATPAAPTASEDPQGPLT